MAASIKDKDFYNEASSYRLGWKPQWFGEDSFNDSLVKAIMKFQKEHKLKPDGLCGPETYRLVFTEVNAKQSLILAKIKEKETKLNIDAGKHIVCGTENVFIPWEKTEVKIVENNLAFCSFPKRKPKIIVLHWDATLNSELAINIMKIRGVSAHFSIDNDGTIVQLVDCDKVAFHAKEFNHESIGIEISNASNSKYQGHYRKFCGKERPLIKDVFVHGHPVGDITGFFPEQVDAARVLIKTLCKHYSIPLITPKENGKDVNAVFDPIVEKRWSGVCYHYHTTERKIDCAGIEIEEFAKG